jgi:tRNA1(Val) A37 N6-methylase TrmN6
LAPAGALAAWLGAAALLLRTGGTLSLIYHADGVGEIQGALAPAFGAIVVQPVHPKPDAAAIRILLCATKGSAAPPRVLPGLLLNRADGQPSAEAEAVLREGAALPLATCSPH